MLRNQSAPDATVVPVLVYENVEEASAWLCNTFGFHERLRAGAPGGVSHAQLKIGNGAVIIGRLGGEFQPPRSSEVSQFIVVHIENVDSHFYQVQQCGARIVHTPEDMPFGERQYTVEDIGGYRWTFSQSVADVAPERWGAQLTDNTPASATLITL